MKEYVLIIHDQEKEDRYAAPFLPKGMVARIFSGIEVRGPYESLHEASLAGQALPRNTYSWSVHPLSHPERKADWDPNHDDEAPCARCGHAYRRHFDWMEGNEHVGCKYCECEEFQEPMQSDAPVEDMAYDAFRQKGESQSSAFGYGEQRYYCTGCETYTNTPGICHGLPRRKL